MSFLSTILESKRSEIDQLESLEILERRVRENERDDIRTPVFDGNLNVIAEIKRRSPSKGELAPINVPSALAKQYEDGGASVISVLTDEQYFGAKLDDLAIVREQVSIPVLRKDFIVDVRQVFETYLMGADMMLLIVAAFEDINRLKELHECAITLGLSVLVETHSLAEIEVAHEIGARFIGINVRDLSTFEENPKLGDEMIKEISSDAVAIWESSISSLDDAKRAFDAGAKAVLIGQGLVQHEKPRQFIQQIRDIS